MVEATNPAAASYLSQGELARHSASPNSWSEGRSPGFPSPSRCATRPANVRRARPAVTCHDLLISKIRGPTSGGRFDDEPMRGPAHTALRPDCCVIGGFCRWGCWDPDWESPGSSGITQARQRLGVEVLERVFAAVAVPVADPLTRGARLAGRRSRPTRLCAPAGAGLAAPSLADPAYQRESSATVVAQPGAVDGSRNGAVGGCDDQGPGQVAGLG